MRFTLSDDQQEIKRTARDLLASRSTWEKVRDGRRGRRATTTRCGSELCSSSGWPGIAVAEEHGGQGLGMVELAALLEELGYACAPVPYLGTVLAALAIEHAGTRRAEGGVAAEAGERRGARRAGARRARSSPDAEGADVVVAARRRQRARSSRASAVEAVAAIDPTRRYGRVAVAGGEALGGDVRSALDRALVAVSRRARRRRASARSTCRSSTSRSASSSACRSARSRPSSTRRRRCCSTPRAAASATYFAAWAADADPAQLPMAAAIAKAWTSDAGRSARRRARSSCTAASASRGRPTCTGCSSARSSTRPSSAAAGRTAPASRAGRRAEAGRPRLIRRRLLTTAGRTPRIAAVLREEARVTPLELFFDLVFVLALTQCTALMAEEPTWEGLGKALLVLAVLWWSWGGYAWLTSLVDPEEGAVRLVMFAAMAGFLVAALCVPEAFDDSAGLFVGAYALVRIAHLALYTLGSRDDPALRHSVADAGDEHRGGRRAARRRVVRRRDAPGRAVVRRDPARLRGPYFFGVEGWKIMPSHFAERFALILIIALGESIVAIGAGVTGDVDAGVVAAAVLGTARGRRAVVAVLRRRRARRRAAADGGGAGARAERHRPATPTPTCTCRWSPGSSSSRWG